MANAAWTDGRESGTGQDTPKVCVHVPPRRPLRNPGHCGTLSRPVPLSRTVHLWEADGQPHLFIARPWTFPMPALNQPRGAP
jgi:hypothetical protein